MAAPPSPDSGRPALRTARAVRLIAHAKVAEDPALRAAVEELRAEGHALELQPTAAPGDAARLAERARAEGVETVVAVGGDGTLNEVINGLFRDGVPVPCSVGLVAMGTANDFARSAGVPICDPLPALRLVLESEPVPIDLGRVGGTAFLNVATGGFVTDVTLATPDTLKDLLGKVAYLLTGLVSVVGMEAKPVRLTGPGLAGEGKAYLLAVGNGRCAGGGFRLCDQARLDDGLLDVFIVPEVPFGRLFGLLGDLLSSTSERYDEAIYCQLPWVEVKAPDGLQFNLDGEPRKGDHFRFEILPKAVRFHVGPGAPLVQAEPPNCLTK